MGARQKAEEASAQAGRAAALQAELQELHADHERRKAEAADVEARERHNRRVLGEVRQLTEDVAVCGQVAESLEDDIAALRDALAATRTSKPVIRASLLDEIRGDVAVVAEEAARLEEAITSLRGALRPTGTQLDPARLGL